jgi:hypothetical protein
VILRFEPVSLTQNPDESDASAVGKTAEHGGMLFSGAVFVKFQHS